jgi:hypothetical protein
MVSSVSGSSNKPFILFGKLSDLDPMYEDGSATSQSGPKVKVRVLL